MLPAAGAGVTTAECDAFVAEWIGRIDEAAGLTTPDTFTDTATTRRIVRRGAWGEARQLQLVRDGYTETPDADAAIKGAESALAAFDTEHSTPEEVEAEGPHGYAGYLW
jgi:hypothetical protein